MLVSATSARVDAGAQVPGGAGNTDGGIAGPAIAGRARRRRHRARRSSSNVDVNAPSADGTPALHWIVRMQDVETARLLLKAGADADQSNRYGVRPLHLAISNGDLAMVKLLLARPGRCELSGYHRRELPHDGGPRRQPRHRQSAAREARAGGRQPTPNISRRRLMVAARAGHALIVSLLLKHGAKVDAQTRTGPTPKFRTPASEQRLERRGIVRGGWPERGERDPTPGAKTPLLYATREGHEDVAKLLLDAGANIEKADADGVTAAADGRAERPPPAGAAC